MKLKAASKDLDPIPGVPWRDMEDDEFAAVSAEYDARFSPEQAGSLGQHFEQDATGAKASAKGAR